ncbi:MAG: NAD(P)/FAD-dependent oxidoreductase [Pseudomonadota bacterium]
MDEAHVETVIIGAGVVGLAIARALSRTGREVIVVEQADAIGTETSARNSEVIHAGIYYPEGSDKARLCVRGRDLLYAYCAERGLAHQRCGKLIVASTAAEMERFTGMLARAHANGVSDLEPVDAAQVAKIEPEITCVGALLSPSTGTVDSHGLMLALQGEAEDHGAMIAFNTPVEALEVTNQGFAIRTGGVSPLRLTCREVINSAGHGAVSLARKTSGLNAAHVPQAYHAKGVYFRLMGKSPFRRLIYPAPDEASLGIHATVDLAGQTRFGPDVEWCGPGAFDYEVDPARGDRFYAAIRKYWPGLKDGSLAPDYAGIRPKICGPGEPAADFMVSGPQTHHVSGLVNLFGIESPGLTSALALGEEVLAQLDP